MLRVVGGALIRAVIAAVTGVYGGLLQSRHLLGSNPKQRQRLLLSYLLVQLAKAV